MFKAVRTEKKKEMYKSLENMLHIGPYQLHILED